MTKRKKMTAPQLCDLRYAANILEKERCFAQLTEEQRPLWRLSFMYRPTFECLVRDGYLEMLPEQDGRREVILTEAGRKAVEKK